MRTTKNNQCNPHPIHHPNPNQTTHIHRPIQRLPSQQASLLLQTASMAPATWVEKEGPQIQEIGSYTSNPQTPDALSEMLACWSMDDVIRPSDDQSLSIFPAPERLNSGFHTSCHPADPLSQVSEWTENVYDTPTGVTMNMSMTEGAYTRTSMTDTSTVSGDVRTTGRHSLDGMEMDVDEICDETAQ